MTGSRFIWKKRKVRPKKLWKTEGLNTFHTLWVDTRVARQGTERGRKMKGARRKVGYHSGPQLPEIAGPMPFSTCPPPPFHNPAQVVNLAPNVTALKHRGKAVWGCLCCLCHFVRCVCLSQSSVWELPFEAGVSHRRGKGNRHKQKELLFPT